MTAPADPCTYDLPAGDSLTVSESRPPTAGYQTAGRRYEVRLTDAQRDAWRAIAARQGCSVADLVRHAVALAAALPPGHIRGILDREQADRLAAALDALESFHTRGCETTCGQPATRSFSSGADAERPEPMP